MSAPAWFVVLALASGCVVRSGYAHRSASGGSVSAGIEAAEERMEVGAQVGVAAFDEPQGRALSIRGDVHVGISSIESLRDLRTVEWSASVFAGLSWTTGDDGRDITFPVGPGLTLLVPIGTYGISLQPRYNVHLHDGSPMGSRHELVLAVGFHWIPAIDFATR